MSVHSPPQYLYRANLFSLACLTSCLVLASPFGLAFLALSGPERPPFHLNFAWSPCTEYGRAWSPYLSLDRSHSLWSLIALSPRLAADWILPFIRTDSHRDFDSIYYDTPSVAIEIENGVSLLVSSPLESPVVKYELEGSPSRSRGMFPS